MGGGGVSGVSISLTGTQARTTTTDANGNYSFNNLAQAGNYTVKPTSPGYAYAPLNLHFTNLSANQTNQNFTATRLVNTISGTVKLGGAALKAVTMTISSPSPAGFAPRTVTTSATGAYSFANLPAGRNYKLTASKNNYNFTPASKSYTNLRANQVNQNFTATLKTYTISGVVLKAANNTGLGGVTMTLTSPTPAGFTPRTITTSANGRYSFVNVPGGRNYQLTPSRSGYKFKNSANAAQSLRSYNNLSANQLNQNFTATPVTAAAMNDSPPQEP